MDLSGKNAIISGGATGAGGAGALIYAAAGAHVAIVDKNIDEANARVAEIRAKGGQAFAVKANVASSSDVASAMSGILDRFDGRIDTLWNHAGTVIIKDFLDTTEDDWDFMMNVNAKSMFIMSQAVIPTMLKQGKGTIVNTSSISAVAGTEKEVLYCTSKGACHMFTRALAIEYRSAGLRVNAVCPGFIRTPHGLRELDELRALGVNVTEADIERLQGRICEPEEIANVALFLASDASSFVNGETVFADNAMLVGT